MANLENESELAQVKVMVNKAHFMAGWCGQPDSSDETSNFDKTSLTSSGPSTRVKNIPWFISNDLTSEVQIGQTDLIKAGWYCLSERQLLIRRTNAYLSVLSLSEGQMLINMNDHGLEHVVYFQHGRKLNLILTTVLEQFKGIHTSDQ